MIAVTYDQFHVNLLKFTDQSVIRNLLFLFTVHIIIGHERFKTYTIYKTSMDCWLTEAQIVFGYYFHK